MRNDRHSIGAEREATVARSTTQHAASLCELDNETTNSVGTTFSMALLSVVVGIVLKLTVKISVALWGAKIINSLIGNSTEGLTSTAMQQGGIGLLLTALIVSVPPMAAMFFQGTLGSFMSYSAFGGGANSPGPQGQPPGAWAAGSHGNRETFDDSLQQDVGKYASRLSTPQQPARPDAVKPHRTEN